VARGSRRPPARIASDRPKVGAPRGVFDVSQSIISAVQRDSGLVFRASAPVCLVKLAALIACDRKGFPNRQSLDPGSVRIQGAVSAVSLCFATVASIRYSETQASGQIGLLSFDLATTTQAISHCRGIAREKPSRSRPATRRCVGLDPRRTRVNRIFVSLSRCSQRRDAPQNALRIVNMVLLVESGGFRRIMPKIHTFRSPRRG
jgi:hypothetical protein